MPTKKISEFGSSDRKAIQNELDALSNQYGIDTFEAQELVRKDHVFGICGLCNHFQYAATKFRIVRAVCEEMNMRLSEDQPIDECTCFNRRGSMSLRDMWDIAYIIDIPKDPVGF